jgi:hypothetical protein
MANEEQSTHEQRVEKTEQAYPLTGANPVDPYAYQPDIPPPPPPLRNVVRPYQIALVIVSALFLIETGLLIYIVGFWGLSHFASSISITTTAPRVTKASSTSTTTKQPASATPPPSTHYTATDIIDDFEAAGLSISSVQYGETIYAWTSDNYTTTPFAQSSATFTSAYSCNGPCDPANYGVWVYNNSTDARTAYTEVLQDMQQPSTPYGPTYWPTSPSGALVHGRCLMLGADANSQFAQVMTQNCM